MDNNPHTFDEIKLYLEECKKYKPLTLSHIEICLRECKKYKPLTEELIQSVIADVMEKQQKDLEEDTVYYYLNGWQKCSGKTYRKVFKECQ